MEQIEILCLGSGSTGNCYAFRKNNQVVLVECGIEYNTICSKLISHGIAPSEIVAAVITHQHKDHVLAKKELIERGIEIHDSITDVKDGAKIKITSWLSAYCFKVEHDVEAYGFALLDTENNQSFLFINDTGEFEFPLKKIAFDVIMIECNFIGVQMDAVKRSNPKQSYKYQRQERYHLSLLGTKNMLSQMNLKYTKTIILMHLSLDCANETMMKTEIETVFGIRTLIAKRAGGMN